MNNSKVTAILSASLLAVFIIALYSIASLKKANQNLLSIYNDRVIPLEQLKNISDAYIRDFEVSVQKAKNGSQSWDSTLNALISAKKKIDTNWNDYLKTYLTKEEKEKIEQSLPLKAKADQILDRTILIFKKNPNVGSALIDHALICEIDSNIGLITGKIDEITKIQITEANNLKFITIKVFYRITYLFVLVTLLCILAFWLFHNKYRLEKKVRQQAKKLTELNDELLGVNDELQTTNEELDVSNEELVAANEEFMTMNEELSSLNEQLEYQKTQLEQILKERTTDLQKSEALFKGIFENANDAIIILNDGYFVDCNKKTLELFECSSNDFLGKTPADFSLPFQSDGSSSLQKAQELIHLAIHEGPQRFEWQHVLPNSNKTFDVEISLSKLEINNEIFLQAIERDITERKNAEASLKLSEEKFSKAFNSSPVLITITRTSDSKVIDCNDSVEKHTGYTKAEFLSSKTLDLGLWIDLEERERFLDEVRLNGFIRNKEVRFKKRDGTIIDLQFSSETINYVGEVCLLSVFIDISDRKKLEQQVLKSVIETEERERLNFSQELHDGLGPLISAIKMYIQLLSLPNSKMKQTTIIEKAENLIEEASLSVREISFKLSPHILQNFGLMEALQAYIDKVKESKKIDISLTHSNIHRYKEITETIIYRVICECINNTIKHANANKIDINLICQDEFLEISYMDNGKGFDVNQTLFSRKGIGLLNIQSRVKSLNGIMNIESNINEGTTIKIKIKTF